MSPLFGKHKPEPAQPKAVVHACGCGSTSFTSGGATVQAETVDGRARTSINGSVLSCLGCGRRWYHTAEGLREPHRDALPPAWAATDLQRAAAQAHEKAAGGVTTREEAPKTKFSPKRDIAREFRVPPRVHD